MNAPRVRRNDWSTVTPPPIGQWRPTRTVSVIIPAYNCHWCLDLALAGLARQTYPPELLEVVVVDDGSEPKLELPEVVPATCRVVRVSDHNTGWGRANALHTGATVSDGEILHWLDADVVPFPEHVEAQARWHQVMPDAVTLGYVRFVPDGPWPDPVQVYHEPVETLFRPERTSPHNWVEEIIDSTNQLRAADHLAFPVHVGATASLPRRLYQAAGGMDTTLRLGEDTELGYRLAQAGAVFVPEPAARSWHLGRSHMMRAGAALRRYNQPFLAERMPHPRWLREGRGRSYPVPLVTAVVTAGGSLEPVRACVDRLLAGDEHDLRVLLVADWDELTDRRQSVLEDPLLDRRLLAATYRGDPRVVLAGAEPTSAFPSPYLLRVPPEIGVGRQTVRQLVQEADIHRVGLLRVMAPGSGPGAVPPVVELWRTAAVSRAQRHRAPGESLADAVTAVWGGRWASGTPFGLVDLAQRSRHEPEPAVVPVAGLRSLLRATAFVTRLAAARARRRLRLRRAVPSARASVVGATGGDRIWQQSGPGATAVGATGGDQARPRSGPAATAVGATGGDRQPDGPGRPVVEVGAARVTVDASTANPRGRQQYGPELPAGEFRLTGASGWEVVRAGDGETVLAGRAADPLDDQQRAALAPLGRVRLPRLAPTSLGTPVAAAVVQLAMTGVVLDATAWSDGSGPLAEELIALISEPLPGGDPMAWEVRSVRQRRTAMRHHAAGLAVPLVSAVLVSKRPQWLVAQVAALAAQTYPELEIVVGLHGAAPPPGLRAAAAGRPLRVVHIPAKRNLGEALQRSTDAANGGLITKVDDDDRYGPEHVWDLVLARHYSGATVVGKGAQLVYLAPLDLTVRQRMGAEFFTSTVAGGTLTLSHGDLAAAGGWPPVRKHVDRALLDRVLAGGGRVYCAHPLGFVYTRHAGGHTWQADLDDFRKDGERTWWGLPPDVELGPPGEHSPEQFA